MVLGAGVGIETADSADAGSGAVGTKGQKRVLETAGGGIRDAWQFGKDCR